MTNATKKPAEVVRQGNIKVAIWRNEGTNGTWYSFTVERSYKDNDGNWKSADSFGRDDALLLARVIEKAHDEIFELQAADRQAEREGEVA